MFSDAQIEQLINLYATIDTDLNGDVISPGFDLLLRQAAQIILNNQIASTSLLQRRLKLGYDRSGKLMDQLEMIGIVGPNQGSKARDVLVKTEADLEFLLSQIEDNGFYAKYKYQIDLRRKEIRENILQDQIERDKLSIRKELLDKEAEFRKKEYMRILREDVLKELQNEGLNITHMGINEKTRESIPQEVMDSVWNRDGGQCAKCGSRESLEFDHIIPFSKGGATSYRNLQLLCNKCNRDKSNTIG